MEEQILDILDNMDDSMLDDTSDSSINIQEPSCTFCPCPFEVLDGLGLQKKEKFFIIYGEYHPLDPKIYAKSKFFEFNPK